MLINNMKININLDSNGVYCMGLYSSSGKTYLFSQLKALSSLPEYEGQILPITYDSNLSSEDVVKLINKFNGRYIILDRLDLYYTQEIKNAIENKLAIVLIDLKNNNHLIKLKMKLVKLTVEKDKIEVMLW